MYQIVVKNNTLIFNECTNILIIILNCKNKFVWFIISSIYIFHVCPISIRYFRLRGFGIWFIHIICLGWFYAWHLKHARIHIRPYFKSKNSCMYAFSKSNRSLSKFLAIFYSILFYVLFRVNSQSRYTFKPKCIYLY